jgi:glycosyltransferase involved in cell wall biosynthesis
MRVLLVHCHYQIRSGEDQVYAAEKDMLRAVGVDLDTFEDDNARIKEQGAFKTAFDTVWSRDAYKAISERLRAKRYDVVHIHNFFPLMSPAIHHAARHAGAAVVQTLHNFRLFCLNGIFFRDGRICEDCVGRPMLLPGIAHGCYRGSRAGSATVATMLQTHRLLGTWDRQVDIFITLYESWRQKLITCGLDGDKIVAKHNFLKDPGLGEGGGDYALFAGRLTVDKGVPHLLEAWQRLGKRIPLKILGDGPLKAEVAAAAERTEGLEYLGTRPYGDFMELLSRARFAISASIWFEAPRVVMEAAAFGVPMIVSAVGPSADLVHDKQTGLHFEPGNVEDLVKTVTWWLDHPEVHEPMKARARQEYEAMFTPEANAERLLKIYDQAIQRRAA